MSIMIKYYKFIAFVIVTAALVLAYSSVWNDSPIVDEIPHIGAGYSYIEKWDMRLNPEHPPLAKDLAGIALKFLNLNNDAFTTKFWNEDINGQWNFGRNLIFNSGNDAIKIAHAAKLSIFIFFILSAVIIYIWTKELFGPMAGLIALFLFSFSPTVMAHSRFVTTDLPALFGVLLAAYFFIRFLKKPNYKTLIIAGLAFGVAQLTKYSLFLLIPYFGLLALIYGWLNIEKHKLRHAIHYGFLSVFIIIIGYVVVVWPVYGLHTINYPPERQKSDTIYLLGSYGNRLIAERVIELSDKLYIRSAAQYGLGLLMVTQRSIGGNTAYFLGEVRSQAWKKYFPVVYFIKEPLAFWGLVIIALFYLFSTWKPNLLKSPASKLDDQNLDIYAMFIWLGIYWFISIRANLNIGVRHLLPMYGFTYMLIANPLAILIQKSKITHVKHPMFNMGVFNMGVTVILIALFGWYFVENLRIYPYYLTYFNQVVGGPSGGHKYVVDSNLDWGQDAKRLADWVRANNIQEKIYLDYFGWTDHSYYYPDKYHWLYGGRFKSAEEFLNENPQGGWIAVSATFYMGSREKPDTSYAWLDEFKPVAVIGNSIFVWRLTP